MDMGVKRSYFSLNIMATISYKEQYLSTCIALY